MESRICIRTKSFAPWNMCARLPQGTSMVDRYRPVADCVVATVSAYNAAHPDGEYVKWADYDALAAMVASIDAECTAIRSCLADLHAVQNGAPLPSYEGAWRRAMDEAERLLGYADADGDKHEG